MASATRPTCSDNVTPVTDPLRQNNGNVHDFVDEQKCSRAVRYKEFVMPLGLNAATDDKRDGSRNNTSVCLPNVLGYGVGALCLV